MSSRPTHQEYTAPSGDRWRIEDAASLLELFEIEAAVLPGWHARMAGQGRMWEVLTRYYGVFPVLAVDARVWDPEEICKHFGLAFVEVDRALDEAVAYWRMGRVGRADPSSAAAASGADGLLVGQSMDEAGEPLPEKRGIHHAYLRVQAMDPAEIDEILTASGFGELTDSRERQLAAMRLMDYDYLLSEPESSALVVAVIRQELDLEYQNREIEALKKATAKVKKDDLAAHKAEIRDMMKLRDAAQSQYQNALKILGTTQAQRPSAQKKVEFQDTLAQLALAAQRYYADADNRLVDGIYTAAEIDFMLRPVEGRSSPYDPAKVIDVWLANLELWESDFKGQRLQKGIVRRLRKAFAAAIEESNSAAGIESRSLTADLDPELSAEEAEEIFAEEMKSAAPQSTAGLADLGDGTVGERQAEVVNTAVREARQRSNDVVAAG